MRGAGLTGAGYVLTQTITFASYIALARLATPEVFGAFAAAWTLVGVSSFLVESGMSSALIQRKDRLDEAAATAVVATFAAGLGLTALALACSPLVGLYFHSRRIGLVAAAMSGVLFLNAITIVPDALMRRRFSFLRRGVIDPIDALAYGAAAAALLAIGMGVWGLVIATYAAGVIRIATVWLFNRWLPDLRLVSFRMWRELASYGRHMLTSEFLRQVSTIANAALLGRFLGLAPLGEYRFGWRMATQAAIPATSAGVYVLFPAFARIADDLDRFRSAFLRSVRLYAVFVVPIGFALPPLAIQITVAFLGAAWRSTGSVLAALAGVTAAFPLLMLANEVFKAANRPSLVARVALITTAGTLATMAAFLPLGITAVAGGISAAYVAAGAYALRKVGAVLDLRPATILASLRPPVFASCAMAGALVVFAHLIRDASGDPELIRLGWLAAESATGFSVYVIALYLLAPATVAEFVRLLTTLVRRDRA